MTEGRFADRTCFLTGSTGMAAAAATALAREGARLFVTSKTPEHAKALAGAVIARGGEAEWFCADLSDEAAVEAAVERCVSIFGRVDVVYNVAGVSGRQFGDGPLHECSLEGWDMVLSLNARSMFLVCRAAVRQMLNQEFRFTSRGVILNMSSALAQHPSPTFFATHAYAASKGAIEAFSRAIASYYAPKGIRVNVIAPALIATPMSQRAQSDPTILAYLESKQPLARGVIGAEDVVGTALYLLSDDSRMVTGQLVAVDGGWGVSEG